MEERTNVREMAIRFRKNCRICGEPICNGEAFFADDITTAHLSCWFDFQAKEDA